jgi:hypothetical protein
MYHHEGLWEYFGINLSTYRCGAHERVVKIPTLPFMTHHKGLGFSQFDTHVDMIWWHQIVDPYIETIRP